MLLVTPEKNIIRLSIHCQIISGMAVCFLRPEQQNIDDILPELSSSMVRFSVFLSFREVDSGPGTRQPMPMLSILHDTKKTILRLPSGTIP
jgi:hypothetical protein